MESNKQYTTPKGIKYGVGTKFKASTESIYTITEADENVIRLMWGNTIETSASRFVKDAIKYFDNNTWIIIQEYQSVDPTTIKFDFANTKIKVDTPEESKWVCKVIYNNIRDRFLNTENTIKTAVGYYISKSNFITFTSQDFYEYGKINKEITIQDILNNQMKEVIEVGDTIGSLKYLEGIQGVVNRIVNDKYYIGREEHEHYRFAQAKLISKGMKQEIIGYELLKDLPGIPAGTKSGTRRNNGIFTFCINDENNINYKESQLQDTTWFKPIYKAKEVVVKISDDREVIIKENKIQFADGVEFVTKEQFAHIKDFTDLKRSFKTGIMPYSVEILTFKIGCESFSKEDIELVQKAIQSFK